MGTFPSPFLLKQSEPYSGIVRCIVPPMGTKRLRGDQAPDDTYLVRWRKIGVGLTALLDRIRRVHTGVILHRLRDAKALGLLPSIAATIHSAAHQLPQPL